jgi:hypothetical protein
MRLRALYLMAGVARGEYQFWPQVRPLGIMQNCLEHVPFGLACDGKAGRL